MDAQDAIVHERGQRQVIEHVRAIPPHVYAAVLPKALVVEPVHLRDLPRLVVPSDEVYPVGIAHLIDRIGSRGGGSGGRAR